jgi:site-specific DNA-methyltransferase (adenine-specific)
MARGETGCAEKFLSGRTASLPIREEGRRSPMGDLHRLQIPRFPRTLELRFRVLLAGDAEAREEEYMTKGAYMRPLLSSGFETTKCPELRFYLRTSSSWAPSPRNTRKRKARHSDTIRSKGFRADHEFNVRWLKAAQRVLKPDGTLWVMGTHHIIFSLGFALQSLRFRIINSLVWHKPDPVPNALHTAFTHAHETLLWAGKGKSARHTFNYDLINSPHPGSQLSSVWRIPTVPRQEKRMGYHPTQKPLRLVRRALLASTGEGDLVFDPFCGSGTTGVAAKELGRFFVGAELEEEFCELAGRRIRGAVRGKVLGEISWLEGSASAAE